MTLVGVPQGPLRIAVVKAGWSRGPFAVLHWSLQTLKSQCKYCETLHNATRDS